MRDDSLPELLWVTYLSFAEGWHMPWHAHQQAEEMLIVTQGQLAVQVHDRPYTASAGTVLFYPRGVEHTERVMGDDTAHMYCLSLRVPLSAGMAWPVLGFDARGRMRATADWMQDLSARTPPDVDAVLTSLLQALLHEFRYPVPSPEDERIARVRRFIREQLAQPLCLDDLAQVACLSPYHFTRLFRQSTGKAPMQYLRAARIEAASWLMLNSQLSLVAIATQTGFFDALQLARTFHQLMGCSPSEFRRRHAIRYRSH